MENYEYRCLFDNALIERKKRAVKKFKEIKINRDLSQLTKDKFKRKKYH